MHMSKGYEETKSLNDRVGEFFFYSVLKGKMPKPPQIYLEVKDKYGNPVEIKLKKKRRINEG